MSINFKAAALALGVASLFAAGQANAAGCDGSIQQGRHGGRSVQCYYMPTMSNGHYVGMQKQVNYGSYPNRYGGNSAGATIGPHPVVYPPHRPPHRR
jgi:hypothetical protein